MLHEALLSGSLSVALKEWATVCRALESGRQIILLRKGGISESIGGFELEHRQFLLYPTYVHQNPEMLKTEAHAGLEPVVAEPSRVAISSAAEVSDVIRLRDRKQMGALDAEHIWTPPLIDMRFNYRPKNPLYLLIVRAFRLGVPVTIENTPAYAGCKSWVPLEQRIDVGGATPAVDDATFERRRENIQRVLANSC
jgi:hypothetical protein